MDQPFRHSKPAYPSWLQPRKSQKRWPNESVEKTAIHAIQCWVYDGGQFPITGCDRISENDIESWLRQPGRQYRDNKPASAGLRLLCRQQQTSWTLPFETDTLEKINSFLGLTEAHAYLNTRGAGVCGHYLENTNEPVFVYHRSNNDGAISAVIKYDSGTNMTVGYILFGPRISADEVHASIILHFLSFPHPLVIPTTVAELTATDLLSEMTLVHLALAKIEQDTGFGDWKDAQVEITRVKPQEWARQLGALTCRFVFLEAAVQCTAMATEFTARGLDSMNNYISTSRARSLDAVRSSLRGRIEFLSSNLAHLQMFASISKRLQAQQNFLFNLMSQQDNNMNHEIAIDSKEIAAASRRDSSAMKIIAVLTTIFLPGTFIATCFAMPLLDWNATTMHEVMTDHFWVYWAVTGPLTLLVMGVVITFSISQAQQQKREMEKAKQGAKESLDMYDVEKNDKKLR